jgi:hypothetical protein
MSTKRNTITGALPSAINFLLQSALNNDYPGQNVLHNYRIFNYRVTLAIVSSEEFKSQSYKQNGFDFVVFQSHGKIPEGGPITSNRATTLSKTQSFVQAIGENSSKQQDFLLEDLYIKSYMSGAKDWATELTLKIVEPYGFDGLFTNIITGLTQKGYYNFDKNNNFVLKIDFIGYSDNSETPELIPFSTRFYPLCITELNANVTQQGTVYDIKAVPMNDTARLDDVNIVPQNLSISGRTVADVMKSLETALNNVGKDNKDKAGTEPHKYKIMFVDNENKPVENNISKSKMFDPVNDTGNREFLKDKKSYIAPVSQQTGELANAEAIVLNINAKDGILNIIDNIITDSYYVVDNIRSEFAKGRDKDGNVEWWRVMAEPYNDKQDESRNVHSKTILIKIYPRTVHFSKIVSLFKPTFVATAEAFEKLCARKYEWQYTGNNKDIISFNMNFNQLWTKVITGKMGQTTAVPGEQKKNVQTVEVATAPNESLPVNNDGTPVRVGAPPVRISPESDSSSRKHQARRGDESNPLFSLSRDINALLNNPYEMVEATIEILGDPMWLGTQFIDNGAVVSPGKSNLFTNDGGIALRTVDPVLRVLAYVPSDINKDGFLASAGDVSRFSAYYTVREVESYFSGGVFRQKLKCNRAIQQDLRNLTTSEQDRFSMKQIDLTIRK